MEGKADLHMHTTHSDGSLTTVELLQRVQQVGLTTIAITDHDNVAAIDEAIAIGNEIGVRVIPGVELSASLDGNDIHILGYFFDHKNRNLLEHLEFFRIERVKRAERIVEKLNDLNVPLKIESVMEQAGKGSVGRPHIANAMVEEGLADTYHEAFTKYIGNGRPAYEKKYQVSPQAAIDLISSAGGLSVVAHPGTMIDEQVLLELIKDGVDGIEVIHPSHSPERVSHYRGIASEYFLLASGGSDFHGGKKNDYEALGRFTISESDVAVMQRRLQ
jgi:predicted metal-dependent phosphoesterase TrpH